MFSITFYADLNLFLSVAFYFLFDWRKVSNIASFWDFSENYRLQMSKTLRIQ